MVDQACEFSLGDLLRQQSRRSGFDSGAMAPIVDHQDINATELGKQTALTAVGQRHRKIAEQLLRAIAKRRIAQPNA